MDSVEALQGLHRDLLILTESRLPSLQRLSEELDARLQEFRALLDKPAKKDASRKAIQSGKKHKKVKAKPILTSGAGTIEIDDETYSLNDEFKNAALQIADEIDIDEIEAAKLFLHAQQEAQDIDRSPLVVAILRFHRHRQLLLDCLRIIIHESVRETEDEDEGVEDLRARLGDVVKLILEVHDGTVANGSKYWRKCVDGMSSIEQWLQRLSDQLQRFSVTGQSLSPELSEVIDFQQQSLTTQHECLAAIASYLVKGSYTAADDVKFLVSKVRRLDKYDRILIHYVAVLGTSIAHFGGAEDVCSFEEASSIHQTIVSTKEAENWALRNFHAAVLTWWLAEFSARIPDSQDDGPLPQDMDAKKERSSLHTQFITALDDGAWHFALSISQDINRSDWYDPARAGLVSFLLHEAHLPTAEFAPPLEYLRDIVSTAIQAFTEALITNMPDTIRRLRSEEDASRKSMRSRFQPGNQDSELHLERFLVIASYAYEGDADAAITFWSDPDSNLYGFLQWAARRQTTPRVAAFCELVRALSDDEACADSVHRFLLDEGQAIAGKFRRTGSLSWSQIINELQFYATTIRDRPQPAQSNIYGNPQPLIDELVEPESSMMLECYLRLVTHLSIKSTSAREWVITNQDIQFHDLLFQLCSTTMESRLRACAFTTLSALCTAKTPETGLKFWSALDQWIYGASSTAQGNMAKSLVRQEQSPSSDQRLFAMLAAGFEEPNAFVHFLQSLATPFANESGLNDQLPFPENLGSTYRMPGMDGYVDFVLGRVFGDRIAQLDGLLQIRMLRLSCLNFTALCLSTFNEDLVTIANRSNVAVDDVIQTSSLSAYVMLHPFARVMEWMFNEKVVQALFATAHQNIEDVNNAATDSPLLLSLVTSIEVITLIMKLQPTYLDVVRPLIKTQSTAQRPSVANAALASFEDAILNNLQIIVDLGLYCGTGHQGLVLASLRLLQILSTSRKLVSSTATGFGYRTDRSKVIAILERNDDAERIARALISELQVDPRELEAGPDAPGYAIKTQILEFISSCLTTLRDRPTIAHVLLGFSCNHGSTLSVSEDGLFSHGLSLFHTVLRLAIDYPDYENGSFVYWTGSIKRSCVEILYTLWNSPLSSSLVLGELRESDYLFVQAITQVPVTTETLWDRRPFGDREFIVTESALAYRNFLQQRTAHYEFMARALRSVSQIGMPTLRSRIESTLLGTTSFPAVDSVANASVFDLFDFVELDLGLAPAPPTLTLIGELDFGICKKDPGNGPSQFDLEGVEELLLLRLADRRKSGQIPTPEAEAKAAEEKAQALFYVHALNQYQETLLAHREALKKWIQLVTIALECCKFDADVKTAFILTALQVVLPKLERFLVDDGFTAIELATLALSLLRHFDTASQSVEGRAGDFAKDRLYQLFRVSLLSVNNYDATPELRNVNYQTCYRYLRIVGKQPAKKSPLIKNILQTVKAAGERLMDVLCDDAVSGEPDCRVSALLVLNSLVALANREKSKYVLDGFARINFVGVLVDMIKGMPDDLRNATAAGESCYPGTEGRLILILIDVPTILAQYHALLALLLRVASTKPGAASVFDAGLFASVRDSLLFAIDPDIGLDFESPEAQSKFFDLMLAVLRVINAVVLSRGQQHEMTLKQAREFLIDCRPSMVGVFKRNAKIGVAKGEDGEDLTDLVDNFTLLIAATGFLEVRFLVLPH